jgi:hypothetical protein
MLPAHMPQGGDGQRREDLWKLYQVALDDRRFQVNLTWDRTKAYFLHNVGLLTIAGGLWKADGKTKPFVIGLLVLATLNGFFAAWSTRQGHAYYRKSRSQVSKLERELGIIGGSLEGSPFASQVTRGQVREITGVAASFADRLTITNAAIVLQVCIGFAAIGALWGVLR